MGIRDSDGLADDLLARVAVHPLGGRVPARDDTVERDADNGLVRMLDDRRHPVRQAAIVFCLLAFRHVAHGRNNQRAVLGVDVGQADVHRELGAIPSPAAQLQATSQVPSLRVLEVGLPLCRVDLPERLRHQCLEGLADQVAVVIAEQRLRLAIDTPDHARPVHPHQGIGHDVQQALERRGLLQRHLAPLRTCGR